MIFGGEIRAKHGERCFGDTAGYDRQRVRRWRGKGVLRTVNLVKIKLG